MSYYAVTYSDSLSHHGIKGQKWGKKNGPPYPLDLEDHSASEKKAGWRSSLDIMRNVVKKRSELRKEYRENVKKINKSDLSWREKKAQKGSELIKYEKGRKEFQFTDKQKKIIKGVLIGAGVVTVAAAAYYVGRNKYIRDNVGETLKKNSTMQIIVSGENVGDKLDHTFYAVNRSSDKMLYKGEYGSLMFKKQLKNGIKNPKVFRLTAELKKDAKIVPINEATNTFKKLYNEDGGFHKIYDYLVNHPTDAGLNMNGLKTKLFDKVTSGKATDREMYDAFNIMLVSHGNPEIDTQINKFYDALKSAGYSGVLDVHDTMYSGYRGMAKNPLIIFDYDAVARKAVDNVSRTETMSNLVGSQIVNNGHRYLAGVGIAAASAAGLNAAVNASNRNAAINNYIDSYKRQHPNTNLSNQEIEDMYRNGRR